MKFILGNFGSGKTQKILQQCQELLNENKSFWIIVPSRNHKDSLLLQLLKNHQKGLVGSPILTLKELQTKLISLIFTNPLERPKTLSNFEQFLLISSVIQQLAPQFKSFTSIQERPELVKMIYRIIQSLRSKDCKNISSSPNLANRIHDIQLILDTYQDHLSSQKLSDAKEENEQITANLHNLPIEQFPDTIFIDGFVDYTASQFKLLSQLSLYLDLHRNIFITLIKNSHTLTQNTLEQWEKIFPNCEVIDCSYKNKGTILADSFLENKTLHLSPIKTNEIQSLGTHKEISTIVNEIKKLQLEQGYNLNDILIISNNIDGYALQLSSALNKSQIPFSLGKDDKLSQNPLIQFIKKIIGFMQEDLNHKTLQFLSRSNYVQDDLRYAFSLAIDYIKAPVFGKKQAWETYLNQIFKDIDNDIIEIIKNNILKLCEHLFSLSQFSNPIGEIIKQLIILIEFFGIQKILSESAPLIKHKKHINQSIAKDYAALLKLKEILQILQNSLSQTGHINLTLKEFSFFFNIITEETRYRSEIPQKDILRIFKPEDTRGTFAKAVFILGLNEGQFPTPPKFELFDNSDRNQLNLVSKKVFGQNIWDIDIDYFQNEKLSFTLSISRAIEQIYFSRTPADEKGSYFGISHFLKKILSLSPSVNKLPLNKLEKFDENSKIFQTYLPAQEYFDKIQIPFKKTGNTSKIQKAINYLNDLENANSYYQNQQNPPPELAQYFGDLSTSTQLKNRYQNEIYLSPTGTEALGRCRYRGLWERIWRLRKYKLPEYQPENSDYGTLYHHVLEHYIRDKSELSTENFFDRDHLKTVLQDYISQSSQSKVFQLDFYFLFQILSNYLKNSEKITQEEEKAIYFELQSGEGIVPLKKISLAHFILSIECRIDRINQNRFNSEFSVLDYKKGSHKSYKDYYTTPFNLFQGFLYSQILQINKLNPINKISYSFLETETTFHEFPQSKFNSLTEYTSFKTKELTRLIQLLSEGNFSPFTLKKDIGEDLLKMFDEYFGDKIQLEYNSKCTYCDFQNLCKRNDKLIKNHSK